MSNNTPFEEGWTETHNTMKKIIVQSNRKCQGMRHLAQRRHLRQRGLEGSKEAVLPAFRKRGNHCRLCLFEAEED